MAHESGRCTTHEVWDKATVDDLLAQGKTGFNQQRTTASFVPTDGMPEPTLEWAVSRVVRGMREVLLLTHKLIDMGAIVLLSNGVTDKGELSGKVERSVTEDGWMRTCGKASVELFGVALFHGAARHPCAGA